MIMKGVMRLAWAFPMLFIGPVFYMGKGTGGAWYWTVLSVAIMLGGAFMTGYGVRTIMRGFFREDR